MKTFHSLAILAFMLFYSCNTVPDSASLETWKQEILEVEADFAAMAAIDGIAAAFLYFAAEDAALMRNDQLFIGREKLEELFANGTSPPHDETLSWIPDFVDVSASGDLAYTYGSYTYSYTDSTGAPVEQSGIFHTVWKRQADGSWRFVWD
jgi:ketosteroid isomerase-like protein